MSWQDERCPADGRAWRDHDATWPPPAEYRTTRDGMPVVVPLPDGIRKRGRRLPTVRGLAAAMEPTERALRAAGLWGAQSRRALDAAMRRRRRETRRRAA